MFMIKTMLAALVVWLSFYDVTPDEEVHSLDSNGESETPSPQPAGEAGEASLPPTPPPLPKPQLNECYDYVVVGAGSAGSVVANRLSASGNYTVLLLEAGGEPADNLSIPFFSFMSANKINSWQYQTVPQEHGCLSFKNKSAPMTQGKLLGGTSGINSMCYVRGNPEDFDSWNNTYGAKNWSFKNVLPYFKEIENFTLPEANKSDPYHGFSGETPINYPNYYTKLSESFLNACREENYSYIDYNGATQYGYSRLQSNTLYGVRMSSYSCFLQKQVFARPNSLHISINSTVTKINFDGEKRAVGVEFTKNGTKQKVRVGREIILSAGAIGSAHLLLLSGIGPAEHLKALNIDVVANLPVGEGLQDHVVFLGLVVTTKQDYIGLANLRNNVSMYEFFVNQTGLWTVPGAYEALLFTTTSENVSTSHPDIKLALTALFPSKDIEESPYVSKELYDAFYKPLIEDNRTGFMNTITMGQPYSRGSVKLNATNPHGPPLIDPNILSNESDIRRTVQGIQKLRKLFEQKSMKDIGAEVYNGTHPNCTDPIWSDKYVECFLKYSGFPSMHVCCTCAMGEHNLSVVDERLKVRHVKGLRVADASVMPRITSGNTHAPVMMIGAKAAEMILADAKAEEEKLMEQIKNTQ